MTQRKECALRCWIDLYGIKGAGSAGAHACGRRWRAVLSVPPALSAGYALRLPL